MKRRADAILKRAQAEYLEQLTPPRDPLLTRIEEFAAKHGHPIADPEVAQLERVLVRATSPRHILEVGTNIGYSVVAMGRECGRETVLETIELNPDTLSVAKSFVADASDPETDALRKFNRRITTDPRLTTIILPLGDGTGISIVH